MSKISLVYYSATGNTEKMAKAIEEGIVEAGGAVTVYKSNAMDKDAILSSDVIVMGSSATGAEVIDENDLLPFMEEAGDKFKGKKVYIFGSYGWGDGEWMRDWQSRVEAAGANLFDDGLIINETPNEEGIALCVELGETFAR